MKYADEPLYPWFGSKRRIAHEIWKGLGKIDNFIDPFFGSGSILLSRPRPVGIETVNDMDHMICNFWRAIKHAPEEVAKHANWPVNEADLTARHYWLVSEGRERLEKIIPDPKGHDAEIAGWWVWGQCCWIGSGWCSGEGPWVVGQAGWELRNAGMGVNRKLPHLRNAGKAHLDNLIEHMRALASRLRYVRVCCGDWSRVLTPSVTTTHGVTGVVLDPPYSNESERTSDLYAQDSGTVAKDVYAWALKHGEDRRFRIVCCGYDAEKFPSTWRVLGWSATGGYSGATDGDTVGKANKNRERLFFSPHCRRADNLLLR